MAGNRTAVVVPGHGWPDLAGVHRISERCLRLVREAEQLVSSTEADVVVFSGWSPTGGPSEAEQMRNAWRGPAVELVVEPTAASTAENAARTLPLLLERGVSSAVVVCAPLHLARARWIFRRVYGAHGISVRLRPARVWPTPGAILWELGALTVAARQVRAVRGDEDSG